MAASVSQICGCGSSTFIKAMNTAKLHLPLRNNVQMALPLGACSNCARTHMWAKGKTLVTSLCHWGMSHGHAGGGVWSKISRTADRNTWPTLNSSLFGFLFRHKHKTLSGGAQFHCRAWSSQKYIMQTESKKTAADHTTDQSGDAKLNKDTETRDRINSSNGKPEKVCVHTCC